MGDDILDRIDEATGCQYCGGELGDSPSGDFCCESHQRRWHFSQVTKEDYAAFEDASTVSTAVEGVSPFPLRHYQFEITDEQIRAGERGQELIRAGFEAACRELGTNAVVVSNGLYAADRFCTIYTVREMTAREYDEEVRR